MVLPSTDFATKRVPIFDRYFTTHILITKFPEIGLRGTGTIMTNRPRVLMLEPDENMYLLLIKDNIAIIK